MQKTMLYTTDCNLSPPTGKSSITGGASGGGVLAETTGSFTSGCRMEAAFTSVAILPALFLRTPETARAGDQRA